MKQSNAAFMAFLTYATFVAAAMSGGACSAVHDGMMGGNDNLETRSGYAKSRAGLDQLRDGSSTYKAGNIGPGRDGIRGGIAQISDGTDMMRSGLGAMSGDMMQRCGGSPESTLDGVTRGVKSMREGITLLDDADASNDTDGMTKIDSGARMADDGMNAIANAMSCMGHGPIT